MSTPSNLLVLFRSSSGYTSQLSSKPLLRRLRTRLPHDELRRNGEIVKLQPQPAKVLSILVSRAGDVVTRQELAELVWGTDTFVDYEHGLNFAIRRIRSVLKDDVEKPRYLETVPKRGYRFIAAVTNERG